MKEKKEQEVFVSLGQEIRSLGSNLLNDKVTQSRARSLPEGIERGYG